MATALSGLSLAKDVARELGMLMPRTVAGLQESTGWAPFSPRGARQFGEAMLDELVLSGFSLLGGSSARCGRWTGVPRRPRSSPRWGSTGRTRTRNRCGQTSIHKRSIAGLAYERMVFEHDPALPATLEADGLGGPARAVVHLCRHPGGPRPWLVWVHGAGQGGTEDLLLSRIGRIHHKLGFNVAMPVQPGHGCRRRQWPAYPDMDPLGNVAGMMRVVSEVRAVVRWVQPQATAVVVAGISMGSPVAALVSHLEKQIDAVALYTPILGLNAMIARHLQRWGSSRNEFRELLESPVVTRLTSVIDPLAVVPTPPPERRLIVGAWHDRMAMREPANALQERWGGQLYWYDGSHVGHIFSRRGPAHHRPISARRGRAERGRRGVRLMAATWTARTVVELYNLVVWNERNIDLADELLADTVIRHEVGGARTLTHAEAVQRVADMWRMADSLRFDLNVVIEGDDGEHVAIVYDSTITTKDGAETNIASIEVFRVVGGKITEVWNCGYQQGVWN